MIWLTLLVMTLRGAVPWGDRTMLPAPNACGSSSLLSLKKGEGSGSFLNINDHPSSPGSSSTSTDESDLLDSPVARDRTSLDSVTAISCPQSTELRSGSWKFAHSQISFSDVLKAPLRNIAKKRPTSHGKGFTICADDFPYSKNFPSNGQQAFKERIVCTTSKTTAGGERGENFNKKAKANAKLELKRCFVQNQVSNDVPQETNKNLCKQNAGNSGTSSHDAPVSDTCCTVYAENLNVPPRPNAMKNTAADISSTENVMYAAKKTDISMLEYIAQKTEAESRDSSAPKHLQTEDREGQVHKQESISRVSTPASGTADAKRSPLILNTILPVKNTEIKIMEQIDPKSVSHSNESRTPCICRWRKREGKFIRMEEF